MEIADNDGGSNNPAPKAKKSRPVLIAATALVLTFGGAIIAQSGQESPTSVEQSIVPQASQSATSVAPAISPATPSATNPPAIASPPSMKGGDGDDDFEEDGHRERRDREHGDRDDDDDHDDDDEFEDH